MLFPSPEKRIFVLRGRPEAPELFACPQDAQCWFECFFPAPKKACVCFTGRPEAPELFACPQALQMHNVGLNAFSQPRKTHLYASRSPRGPRVVCLPSGSPDAQCWFECFFPAPKKSMCVLRGRPEASELFACPQALQMHNVGLNAFSSPEKRMCMLRGLLEAPELFACPCFFPSPKKRIRVLWCGCNMLSGCMLFPEPAKKGTRALRLLTGGPAYDSKLSRTLHSVIALADHVVTVNPLTFQTRSGLVSADHVVTVNPLTFRNLAGPRAGVCVCVRLGCMLFPEPAKSIWAFPANHVVAVNPPTFRNLAGGRTV